MATLVDGVNGGPRDIAGTSSTPTRNPLENHPSQNLYFSLVRLMATKLYSFLQSTSVLERHSGSHRGGVRHRTLRWL